MWHLLESSHQTEQYCCHITRLKKECMNNMVLLMLPFPKTTWRVKWSSSPISPIPTDAVRAKPSRKERKSVSLIPWCQQKERTANDAWTTNSLAVGSSVVVTEALLSLTPLTPPPLPPLPLLLVPDSSPFGRVVNVEDDEMVVATLSLW